MYCLTGTYPNAENAYFDLNYYVSQHMALVEQLAGDNLIRTAVRKRLEAADGSPPAFICQAHLWVHRLDALEQMIVQHADRLVADVANFTNVAPTLQVEEVVGST
jgi:uncharacterized protein (TIGR02118 family)